LASQALTVIVFPEKPREPDMSVILIVLKGPTEFVEKVYASDRPCIRKRKIIPVIHKESAFPLTIMYLFLLSDAAISTIYILSRILSRTGLMSVFFPYR
jgi:hypothetical protein